MSIDRQLLHQAEQALTSNIELDDRAREYAANVLRMVNQLAFHGYDLDRIYDREIRQKVGRKTQQAMWEMHILGIAHKRGRGMEEAKAYLQAKRQGKNVISAAVAYIQVVEGISKREAQKKLAECSGRDPDDIKRMCTRERGRKI